MRVMEYVNKFNRGVTRVQEMLKDNGNPPAEFDVNTITAFRVNVHATNESDFSKGTSQGTSQDGKTIEEKIIEFCKEPRSLAEIMLYLGYKERVKFKKKYINPLLGNVLSMTFRTSPIVGIKSILQQYKKINLMPDLMPKPQVGHQVF